MISSFLQVQITLLFSLCLKPLCQAIILLRRLRRFGSTRTHRFIHPFRLSSVDSWKQSYHQSFGVTIDIAHQLNWTWRKAAKSMGITSFTTFFAFLMTATSPIPAVKTFGIFAALMVFFNYLYIISWYPAAISKLQLSHLAIHEITRRSGVVGIHDRIHRHSQSRSRRSSLSPLDRPQPQRRSHTHRCSRLSSSCTTLLAASRSAVRSREATPVASVHEAH